MTPADYLKLTRDLLDNPGNAWSMGVFGASAEFNRSASEPSKQSDADGAAAIYTDKGGLRIEEASRVRAIAFDGLSSDGETWSQAVAFCQAVTQARPHVISSLGEDKKAIRLQDRSARLFDIGAGRGLVRMCVRTEDSDLIEAMEQAEEASVSSAKALTVFDAILRAQPHRVMISPAARIEVYQPIPAADGVSPDGPHTHMLPRLLAKGLTHSANTPVPSGFQSVLNCHPKSPWRDARGCRKPFDAEADKVFETLLDCFGLQEDRSVRRRVEAAVARGTPPAEFDWPGTRRGRAQARIALRRLAASEANRQTAAWRARYDRGPSDAQGEV